MRAHQVVEFYRSMQTSHAAKRMRRDTPEMQAEKFRKRAREARS